MDFNDYIELDVDYYDMERGYLFHSEGAETTASGIVVISCGVTNFPQ